MFDHFTTLYMKGLITQHVSEVVNELVQGVVNSEASKKIHRWTKATRTKPSFVFWDILSGIIGKVIYFE